MLTPALFESHLKTSNHNSLTWPALALLAGRVFFIGLGPPVPKNDLLIHQIQHYHCKLFPLLQLIIDDYGHWAGCRKAVDEYFADKPILLNRIDYTGVIGIKVPF